MAVGASVMAVWARGTCTIHSTVQNDLMIQSVPTQNTGTTPCVGTNQPALPRALVGTAASASSCAAAFASAATAGAGDGTLLLDFFFCVFCVCFWQQATFGFGRTDDAPDDNVGIAIAAAQLKSNREQESIAMEKEMDKEQEASDWGVPKARGNATVRSRLSY